MVKNALKIGPGLEILTKIFLIEDQTYTAEIKGQIVRLIELSVFRPHFYTVWTPLAGAALLLRRQFLLVEADGTVATSRTTAIPIVVP